MNKPPKVKGEIWKKVNDDYLVSNMGRVWSRARGIVKPRLDDNSVVVWLHYHDGYENRRKSIPLSRLVMHTFKGDGDGKEVHHSDGDSFNNKLSNLVYVTRKEHQKLHPPCVCPICGCRHNALRT